MTTYSVYIIELDPAVRTLDTWIHSNPEQTRANCFYVGQTAHSAKCRFEQHKLPARAEFHCICDLKRGELVNEFSIGRAKFASKYSNQLRPDLYDHLNPIASQSESKDIEESTALTLRSEGYGTHFG
jgi:hypothetical protein